MNQALQGNLRGKMNPETLVNNWWAATAPVWYIDVVKDVSQTKGEEAMAGYDINVSRDLLPGLALSNVV